jgi:L-threonylcarbamoyladenylate synthase
MTRAAFTQDLASVADALNSGRLAIVPTDTVYGLAASIQHPKAIARIFEAKGRPSGKPIPILLDSPKAADQFLATMNERATRLIKAFWPGALTIVFPASAAVPNECLANGLTVGLRVPHHAMLRQLITHCGGALAVTSANRSGEAETASAIEAFASLADYADIVLDCGTIPAGRASAVVDPFGQQVCILRPGDLDSQQIFSVAAGM